MVEIPFQNLLLALIPVGIVVVILIRWSLDARTAVYAICRMFLQLLLIGYVLEYIFRTQTPWIPLLFLSIMLTAAALIAMRHLPTRCSRNFLIILGSIAAGGVTTLAVVTQAVLTVDPWFQPDTVIPLAGMIFANSMNVISLCAERYYAESKHGGTHAEARSAALQAALIPHINTLMAVGLVSLPGMMTGQILAGTAPRVAALYQIMVMCMIFGSAGISAACFLHFIPHLQTNPHTPPGQ